MTKTTTQAPYFSTLSTLSSRTEREGARERVRLCNVINLNDYRIGYIFLFRPMAMGWLNCCWHATATDSGTGLRGDSVLSKNWMGHFGFIFGPSHYSSPRFVQQWVESVGHLLLHGFHFVFTRYGLTCKIYLHNHTLVILHMLIDWLRHVSEVLS